MSYPLINGAAINESDEEVVTEGIDLVQAGHHLAVNVGLVAGFAPLELGEPSVKLSIRPPGLELVSAGQHSIRYNQALKLPGLDFVSAGTVSTHSTLYALGASPLELGSPRVKTGVDVELVVGGMDLVRTAQHGILPGLKPDNKVLMVAGKSALELGDPQIVLKTITVTAQGFAPMELGTPSAGQSLQVAGASPMELGTPSVVTTLKAKGASPLELGTPSVSVSLGHSGIDLVRAGKASMHSGDGVLQVAGAAPLELGQPEPVAITLYARPFIALELGTPRIDRGTAC